MKALLAAGLLGLAGTTVLAQDFPSGPIRIVVPYAAGGPSDTGTRLVQEPLTRQLGKPVVIENRGGGGGLNATEAYLKAEPDWHTLLVGAIGPLTIIPALKPVSYDVEKDIVPLTTVWRRRCWRCGPRWASRAWPSSSPMPKPTPTRSPSAPPASAP
jgi:tripartite-type tricarboxylate transporter receptor subunit TctC